MWHRAVNGTNSRKLLLGAMLSASLFGFGAWPAQADIKIGFQAPLSGFAATDGKSAKIAAEMAIEDINNAGGVLGEKLSSSPMTIRPSRIRRSSPPTS